MKRYLAVSFLIVFLYIYAVNAEGTDPTCTPNDNGTCTLDPGTSDYSCIGFEKGKTISQGEYIECFDERYFYCQTNGECPMLTLTKTLNRKCEELTGTDVAKASNKNTVRGIYDCYIPEKTTDNDEKGTFTYLSQCSLECASDYNYLCPSA